MSGPLQFLQDPYTSSQHPPPLDMTRTRHVQINQICYQAPKPHRAHPLAVQMLIWAGVKKKKNHAKSTLGTRLHWGADVRGYSDRLRSPAVLDLPPPCALRGTREKRRKKREKKFSCHRARVGAKSRPNYPRPRNALRPRAWFADASTVESMVSFSLTTKLAQVDQGGSTC